MWHSDENVADEVFPSTVSRSALTYKGKPFACEHETCSPCVTPFTIDYIWYASKVILFQLLPCSNVYILALISVPDNCQECIAREKFPYNIDKVYLEILLSLRIVCFIIGKLNCLFQNFRIFCNKIW